MSDLDRMKQEYAARKVRLSGDDRYSMKNPAYQYTVQQRGIAVQKLLERHSLHNLAGMRILEIGCGSGGVLKEYQELGADPSMLFGIDLLADSLQEAHNKLPLANFINVDGQFLPFSSNAFDVVLQYTAFSSVLDPGVKQKMAAEILRVLKPSGIIIWYDFWWNPTNRQTRGIRPQEVKALFPSCEYDFQRITLAPPISRIIVPISKKIACLLEMLVFLNSHYLGFIRK